MRLFACKKAPGWWGSASYDLSQKAFRGMLMLSMLKRAEIGQTCFPKFCQRLEVRRTRLLLQQTVSRRSAVWIILDLSIFHFPFCTFHFIHFFSMPHISWAVGRRVKSTQSFFSRHVGNVSHSLSLPCVLPCVLRCRYSSWKGL